MFTDNTIILQTFFSKAFICHEPYQTVKPDSLGIAKRIDNSTFNTSISDWFIDLWIDRLILNVADFYIHSESHLSYLSATQKQQRTFCHVL